MNPILLPKNYRKASPQVLTKKRRRVVARGSIGLGNWFRVEIEKPGIGTRFLSPWFPNHITDQGLDLCATSTARFNACQVGSGNAAPTDADTGLQSYTAGTSSKSDLGETKQVAVSPYYVESYWRYNFALGAFNDDILSEVMIGTSTSGGSCFSRELIRDAVGAPTTIQVASDEILRVHHKLRNYPPMVDVIGTVTLDVYETPTDFDYVRRAAGVGAALQWAPRFSTASLQKLYGNVEHPSSVKLYSGGMGGIGSFPYGPSVVGQGTSISLSPYSAGSFSRGVDVHFSTATGNGDIRSILIGQASNGTFNNYIFQMELYPVLEKINQDTLDLSFITSWGRYEEPSV